MAGRPIYLIFLMTSPRLELRTLAECSALIADSQYKDSKNLSQLLA